MPKIKLSKDQRLLINLMLGKAINAILTRVSDMSDDKVKAMISDEEALTDSLLDQMRKIV